MHFLTIVLVVNVIETERLERAIVPFEIKSRLFHPFGFKPPQKDAALNRRSTKILISRRGRHDKNIQKNFYRQKKLHH